MIIQYLTTNILEKSKSIKYNISKLEVMSEDELLEFIENIYKNNKNFIFKGSVSELVSFENILLKYGFKYDNIETIKDGISYFEAKFCILKTDWS